MSQTSRGRLALAEMPDAVRPPRLRGPSHEQIAAATDEYLARGGVILTVVPGVAYGASTLGAVTARIDLDALDSYGHVPGRAVHLEWN